MTKKDKGILRGVVMTDTEFKRKVDKIIELKGRCSIITYYISCDECAIKRACQVYPDTTIPVVFVPYIVACMIRDSGYDYESVLFDILL